MLGRGMDVDHSTQHITSELIGTPVAQHPTRRVMIIDDVLPLRCRFGLAERCLLIACDLSLLVTNARFLGGASGES